MQLLPTISGRNLKSPPVQVLQFVHTDTFRFIQRRPSIEETVVVMLQNKQPQQPTISSFALYKVLPISLCRQTHVIIMKFYKNNECDYNFKSFFILRKFIFGLFLNFLGHPTKKNQIFFELLMVIFLLEVSFDFESDKELGELNI